jgi:Putative Actinobacterial Holin-X, holin superfamily III
MVQRVHATARDQPLGDLIVALAHDGKAWLAAEVAVMRAQIEENTRKLLSVMILLVIAAVIALAGIVVLAHTLVLVLASAIGVGLAGLLVGGILVALAVVFVLYAGSTMDFSQLVPERLRSGKSFTLNKGGP